MKRITTVLALVACVTTLTASLGHAATSKSAKVTATTASAPAATKAATTPAASKSTPAAGTTASKKSTMAARNLVDLNSATKEQLEKLPGVGDATAEKIIAGRPWAAKDQLLSKGVVNRATYAKLRGWVIAKQSK